MSIFTTLEDHVLAFWSGSLRPFLKNLLSAEVKAEMTALEPIAISVAANLAADFAASGGNLSQFAKVAGAALVATAAQAETAAVMAGGTSLLAAVSAAVAPHTAPTPAAAAQ